MEAFSDGGVSMQIVACVALLARVNLLCDGFGDDRRNTGR